MSMIVKDFIAWLQTQDQEAIVEIVNHRSGGSYYEQGGTASWDDFDKDKQWEHWEYVDFRDNQFVKPHADYFGKRYLRIGGKDN